jgi:hypothetical protein
MQKNIQWAQRTLIIVPEALGGVEWMLSVSWTMPACNSIIRYSKLEVSVTWRKGQPGCCGSPAWHRQHFWMRLLAHGAAVQGLGGKPRPAGAVRPLRRQVVRVAEAGDQIAAPRAPRGHASIECKKGLRESPMQSECTRWIERRASSDSVVCTALVLMHSLWQLEEFSQFLWEY